MHVAATLDQLRKIGTNMWRLLGTEVLDCKNKK